MQFRWKAFGVQCIHIVPVKWLLWLSILIDSQFFSSAWGSFVSLMLATRSAYVLKCEPNESFVECSLSVCARANNMNFQHATILTNPQFLSQNESFRRWYIFTATLCAFFFLLLIHCDFCIFFCYFCCCCLHWFFKIVFACSMKIECIFEFSCFFSWKEEKWW